MRTYSNVRMCVWDTTSGRVFHIGNDTVAGVYPLSRRQRDPPQRHYYFALPVVLYGHHYPVHRKEVPIWPNPER